LVLRHPGSCRGRLPGVEAVHQRCPHAGPGDLSTPSADAGNTSGGPRMGSTPADTQREITRLPGDMAAALDEMEKRVRGGLRGIATSEAKITSVRARDDAVATARENPTLLGVGGVVVAGAVAYGVFSLINGLRQRGKPQSKLK